MRALDGKTIFTLRRGGRYTVIEVNDATLESIKMPLHFDPINDDYVLEYVEDGAVKTLDIHLSRRAVSYTHLTLPTKA